jgi:hypothetical protein
VKLAEERDGAAGPKEVGEEVGFRPEDLTEAVVQSILEAATRAEADDLLSGIWWSGAELLQSLPGHVIVRHAASIASWGDVYWRWSKSNQAMDSDSAIQARLPSAGPGRSGRKNIRLRLLILTQRLMEAHT